MLRSSCLNPGKLPIGIRNFGCGEVAETLKLPFVNVQRFALQPVPHLLSTVR